MKTFSVNDDGNIFEVPLSADSMRSTNVLLLLDEAIRIIWIWKGENASVRKKFISAHTASELRKQVGMVYNVKSIDEGYEPENFLSSI